MRVVDVREVDPPAGAQDRIHWCLLTTHAVATATDALQIVKWYRLRWIVEQVFRMMKTDGVDVETSQITIPGNLLKLLTVALIAALRVMQLAMGRDGRTGQPLTDAIVDAAEVPALQAINATPEGRTEKLKNPFDPSSLAWYAWIAARLAAGKSFRSYRTPVGLCRGILTLSADALLPRRSGVFNALLPFGVSPECNNGGAGSTSFRLPCCSPFSRSSPAPPIGGYRGPVSAN